MRIQMSGSERSAPVAARIHPDMRQAQFKQPIRPLFFLKHGYGSGATRHDAEIADDANRRQMPYRPAGFGIQYMRVSNTVYDDTAFVIAAAG